MILRINELVQKLKLSRTTIWRLEKNGEFPSRLKLGPNSVGWLSTDIDEWIESLKGGSNDK